MVGLAVVAAAVHQRSEYPQALPFIVGLFFWFGVLLLLPSLIGGVGLLLRKRWARVLVIVVSVEFLFAVPIGTALGGYGLWALLSRDAQSALGRELHPQPWLDGLRKSLLFTILGGAAAFFVVLNSGLALSPSQRNSVFGLIAALAIFAVAAVVIRSFGKSSAAQVAVEPERDLRPSSPSDSTANIWNLAPGAAIRVVQEFRDCAGNEFAEGRILHFTHRDYLPYHSGHTVYFREATMYLCDDDETGAIVQNRGCEYYVLAEQAD